MAADSKKSNKLEQKGDKLVRKKKYDQALDVYEEALDINDENSELIDKLIEAHQHSEKEWDLEDFTKELSWTMKKQELENPRMERVHAKLSPEFEQITQIIFKLAEAPTEEMEEVQIDQLIPHGEKALVPLIEFIRALKHREDD